MIRRPPISTLFPTPTLFHPRGVNCLVLDEPTNHLDVEAIEELESALAGYVGTVLLVTHDRRFLDRKSTRLNSSHANISYAVFCLKKKQSFSGVPYCTLSLLQ